MKPEVKIIQNQDENINDNPNIDNWEAEQLLRKYGYSKQPENNPVFHLPKVEDKKVDNFYNETTYGTDEETGFSFKINIQSDMNIPKNY